MNKESFESTEHNIPQPIREFAMSLPEDLKNKCIGLFSKFLPSLPLPIDLEEFSETLSIAEKAEFWKAVSQVQAQFVNPVPLPSLPTSDNINACTATPPNFDGTNNLVLVADEVCCEPPTNEGAAAPKNKWELSFVAPIIDEEGVPSRQFFSQLMEGIKAVKEPEKEKTPFLRSTDVQREVARKSIENNTFLNDRCLDEDQKAVIAEFKRIWEKEKKRVACNERFCLTDSNLGLFAMFLLVAGITILIVGLSIKGKSTTRNARIALIATGASLIACYVIILICSCFLACLFSLGVMRSLSDDEFSDELKGVMRPCVERRIKDWRRKKEWRWFLTRKERKIEEKIDKEEEERKKKEENEKLSREAAIEMEKLQMKQVMTVGTSGAGNDKFTNQAFSSSVAVEMEVEPRAIMKEDGYV
ncbi:uncharacterized protein MONOS_14720 [Monocercomonoides exilis]|uniref:uncharacterized protein n=1 Tax=Monocercomonoides exilis TaxID=2049356 RepID=UPI003559446B|nr:hypothetical protein MONOS_14720 [Monocercomonoides exilis]|eukprot:MONOS_14720.1-p1 / transcript=MONOS_14720.1 / gene=MONOS_14720 / organism=Monocercomonoides_exilis_PA203 / gene_product=unspecified product / transcript_product=unspecified product / location=Mono_scaffold01058:8374-9621(+) / protein_length=416 / sequence_SO=supercontig / SO=protein_coding / is_pseudo=false